MIEEARENREKHEEGCRRLSASKNVGEPFSEHGESWMLMRSGFNVPTQSG